MGKLAWLVNLAGLEGRWRRRERLEKCLREKTSRTQGCEEEEAHEMTHRFLAQVNNGTIK